MSEHEIADPDKIAKVYGPRARRFNRLRVRTWRSAGGWTSKYRHRDGWDEVSGCDTRAEAVAAIRHFVTLRVVEDGEGGWVEAPPPVPAFCRDRSWPRDCGV